MKKVCLFMIVVAMSMTLYCSFSYAGNEVYTAKDIFTSGKIGNSITWTLYKDGFLYAEGSGELGNNEDLAETDFYGWRKHLEKVKKVELSEGITSVGNRAFFYCINLKEIKLPSTLKVIHSFAFTGCNIGQVELPSGLESICQHAFSENNGITQVVIPNSITYLSNAFSGCKGLKNVYFEANKNSWFSHGMGLFSECDSLESIDVEEGHTVLKSIDGVLYDVSGKYLYQYPGGKKDKIVNIRDNVEWIESYAFGNTKNVEKIVCNEGLKYIGTNAFYCCDNMKELVISSTVESIDEDFILGYDSLAKIVNNSNIVIKLDKLDGVLWKNTKGNYVYKVGKETVYSQRKVTSISLNYYNYADVGEERPILAYFNYGVYAHNENKNINDLVFKSSDTNVVKIDQKGNMKMVGPGLATITVSSRYYDPNNKATYVSESADMKVIKDIDKAKVILGYTSTSFDNKEKRPSVKVILDNKVLTPNKDYICMYRWNKYPGEAYIGIDGKGFYYGYTVVTFKINPPNIAAPSKVTATLYGHDDAKISWKKSSGASGYYIYYKTPDMKSYKKLGSTTKLSYKKSNLPDGKKVVFRVYPYVKLGGGVYRCSNWKNSNTIYTLKKISTPKITKSGNNKVKVSWTNIDGETGYQISKSTSKKKTSIVSTYKTTSGKSKVIKATRKKTYYYKVRAYKTVGGKKIYGPWSSVKSYKLK